MKSFVWIVAVAGGLSLLSACGNDCDDAVDKLEECGLPAGGATGDCDDTSQCEADCINDHSCDEINEAFAGTPNDYSDCDDACN